LRLRNEIAYAHNLGGNVTFLNQARERILGYTYEEVCHMNITELMATEMSEEFCREMTRTFARRIGTVLKSG